MPLVNGTDVNCTQQPFCYSESMKCTDLAANITNLTITVGIDDAEYVIQPAGYLAQDVLPGFSGTSDGYKCIIQITHSNETDLRLGNPFMRNYFTAFHLEKNQVSIAPTAGKPDIVDPPVPPPTSSSGLGDYAWVGIILAIVVVVMVLGFLALYCVGKHGKKNSVDSDSDEEIRDKGENE